jgi:hypothetical protein
VIFLMHEFGVEIERVVGTDVLEKHRRCKIRKKCKSEHRVLKETVLSGLSWWVKS